MKNQTVINEIQLQFETIEPVFTIPEVDFLKKRGIKPSPLYNSFWKFATERQHIFQSRMKNEKYPWTDDIILLKYKFTNAYRASDRVSQYLIHNVIYTDDYKTFSQEDVFFRIILFKTFNKIETWELLEKVLGRVDYSSYSFSRYDSIMTELLKKGGRIYSAAYIMPSGKCFGSEKKHRNNLRLIEMMMSQNTAKRISKTRNLKDLYELLISYPSIGEFLAFQYAIDINYSELCDFSEMDYVIAGPGARSGISKLFLDKNGYSDEYIIRLMAENQEKEFHRLNLDFQYLGDRRLQLIDCQNIFCETDKYTRVAYPYYQGKSNRKRIKQLFTPNISNPIKYFYPPKWEIKL